MSPLNVWGQSICGEMRGDSAGGEISISVQELLVLMQPVQEVEIDAGALGLL
jgi:hypothetical protein